MAILTETERMIVDTVHDFVDREVRPVVRQIEHANEYPEKMIEQMKELGIFGLAIPEELGGTKVSMPCYVHVTEELARGWMSLAGAMGGHTVVVQAARRVRHGRAAGDVPAAAWRPARCAPPWRSPSPAAARTCRRCGPWPCSTATTTSSTAPRRGSRTPAGPGSSP